MRPAKPLRTNYRRLEFKRSFARYLRANPSGAERKLWNLLRGKQMAGLRFRRQHPIGPYIADFFCSAAKLIVELDGSQHSADANIAYDAARTRWLEERGYMVLRFDNAEVLKDSAGALERIWLILKERRPLPEPPLAVRPSLKGRVD
jgi:very-short-patch-repair endonuclease